MVLQPPPLQNTHLSGSKGHHVLELSWLHAAQVAALHVHERVEDAIHDDVADQQLVLMRRAPLLAAIPACAKESWATLDTCTQEIHGQHAEKVLCVCIGCSP